MTEEEKLKEFSKHWENTENDATVTAYIISIIERTKAYINRVYGEEIPESSDILDEYFLSFKKADESTVSISDFYLLRTIKEISKRPDIIFEMFNKLRDSKSFWSFNPEYEYKYTASREENWEKFANDFFHNVLPEIGLKFDKNRMLTLNDEERKDLSKFIRVWLDGEHKQRNKVLISNYAKGIVLSVKELKRLGILDSLIDKNNIDRKRMGLEALQFEFSENDSNKYGLERLMDVEFLQKLSLEKLALIHGFYSNRLKKVTTVLGKGLFICAKLNDFDLKNKHVDIDKAKLAYSQYMAMDNLCTSVWGQVMDNIKDYSHPREEDLIYRKYTRVDLTSIYDKLISQFEKAYSLYSGGEDKLNIDFFMYFSTQVSDYWQKDFSLETLLLIAMENFKTINWGYIPENDDYGKNSIIRKKENILLGFDMDGFNMPVRLHMPVEKVKAFFKNVDRSYEIPNYIGNEDMAVWGRNMGASLIMPLSPQHRKFFISTVKKMKSTDRYYAFARHIECMQYDNNLFRIQKWKDPNGRKGARTYTNLLTGEEINPLAERV